MNIILYILSIIILFSSPFAVMAEGSDNRKFTIDEALGALCGTDLQIGLRAIEMKEKGKSRKHQQASIDAIKNNSRKKRIMNSALYDAYEYPNLPKKTYAMYRMEICYQQISGRNIPEFLSKEITNDLIKCDNLSLVKAKYSCINKVSLKYSQ